MAVSPENLPENLTGAPADGKAKLSVPAIQNGLETLMVGKNLRLHPELESTNSEASRLAREGVDEGTVVLADSQTHGKGRRGRIWVSPGDCNIYLSVILLPKQNLDMLGLWTMGAGLAVSRAIELTTGLSALLKWPNDLRIKGKKVGGILMESVFQGSRIKSLILGLGLNVNMAMENFPADIRETSSSLSIFLGKTVDRNAFCRTILGEIELMRVRFNAGETESIVEAYRACSETLNQQVRVGGTGEDLTGTAVGFSDRGELLLKLASGEVQKIRSEDIEHLRGLDASGH